MTKVMVFGTFDSLHRGHIFFLNEALKRGDVLIAVTARDETVDELKGRSPLHNYGIREKKLIGSGLIDRVVPSDRERGSWGVVKRERPDVICLGHDQSAMKQSLDQWLKTQKDYHPFIEILPPHKRKIFSTTAHRKRRDAAFILLLFLAMLLMAFSWISGKVLTGETHFTILIFWRFVLSLIPFLFFMKEKDSFKIPTDAWKPVLFSSLSLIMYNVFFFTGLKSGLAGKGGLMVTTLNPLFTTTIILLIHRKKPGPLILVSLLLGIGGGVIFMEPWNIKTYLLLDKSNLLFMGAALFWALLTIFSSKALKIISLGTFNFYLYLSAAVAALIWALPEHPFRIQNLSFSFWINIFFLSFFVTALATSLYFKAAQKLGPSRASSFTFVIPLMALLLSWFFLDEVPRWSTMGGGILSLSGLYLINTTQEKT